MGGADPSEGVRRGGRPLTGRVVRVLPDVAGIDRSFDYLAASDVVVGEMVRVPLNGRVVTGWVIAIGDVSDGFSAVATSRLVSVAARVSCGPSAEVVALSAWIAEYWAGPRRAVLVSASPSGRVPRVATMARRLKRQDVGHAVTLLRRGPLVDPVEVVRMAMRHGPLVVVVPTVAEARRIAATLRGDGFSVASNVTAWASAAGGVDVVVGARSAILASAPDIGAIVVIDEHDDALQEERSPTWHARDVAVERARRLGVPVVLHSPVPSPGALALAEPDVAVDERASWPTVTVVERDGSSLISTELGLSLRDHARRVLCVLNTKGRSRLLACMACRAIATCEQCDAAVTLDDSDSFACRRCGLRRPQICRRCGTSRMANIRPGTTRIAEELTAASGGRDVRLIEATEDIGAAPILVGTEAALHRRIDVDEVWFLDADQEWAAPRFRAVECFVALIGRAARLVGRRGTVAIQTADPSSPVADLIARLDLDALARRERDIRQRLDLPPFGAIARVVGDVDLPAPRLGASATAHHGRDILVKGRDRGDVLALVAEMRASGRVRAYLDPPRV